MSFEDARLDRRDPEGVVHAGLDWAAAGLEGHDYIQQEWTLRGEVDGYPYETLVTVRRPRDAARFTGVVIAEPLHSFGHSAFWASSRDYIMASGHGWASIAAQPFTLELVIKPSNPERYGTLHLPSRGQAPTALMPPFDDWDALRKYWNRLDAHQPYRVDILAQGASAIRRNGDEIFGAPVAIMTLGGVSENAHRTANFLESPYATVEPPLFDGFLPAAYPSRRLTNAHAPIIQVLNEGDVSDPGWAYRPGYEGRQYRRPDSDDPADRYRLYEIAGTGHGDQRDAPFNDLAVLAPLQPEGTVTEQTVLNSMPWNAMLTMAMQHLIEWVRHGTTPPRAERLALDDEGRIAKDEHGNALGGVRSAELDVPVATYQANAPDPRNPVTNLLLAAEVPFDAEKLRALYGEEANYRAKYRDRIEELVRGGWLLQPDAERLVAEASFPASSIAHTLA